MNGSTYIWRAIETMNIGILKSIYVIGVISILFFSSVMTLAIQVKITEKSIIHSDVFITKNNSSNNFGIFCFPEYFAEQKYQDLFNQSIAYNIDESKNYSNNDYQKASGTDAIEKMIWSLNGPMNSPWPMQGHDAEHTGRSPYSTIDNSGIEKWRFDTKDEVTSCPVVDDQGVIYVAADYFYAVYPDGTMKWKYAPLIWTIMAPAIDENGIIYFGSIYFNSYLHAVYTINGTLKWKYPIGNSQSSPTIGDDGIIYVGATDNWNVFAFYQNGTPKWSFHANEKIYSSPTIGADNTIYFGSWDHYLYALYQNNGTLKWKYDTGGGIRTSPCIDDEGIIYTVSATNGYLNAIYPNGTLKWRTYTNGGTSPTIGPDGTIYCGWTNLYAINPWNGSIKWTFNPGPDSRIEEATPCTSSDGTIFFGTHIGEYDGGELIAVNPDGTERWRIMLATDWIMSAPAIGEDGTVYVGSFNDGYHPGSWGYLHAIGPLDPNAPTAPEINGPSKGKVGTSYNYTFTSTSPLGKDVYYYIDWGDNSVQNWIGPYASGETATVSHTYEYGGTYTISARAKDTDNLWGPWGTLSVTMPVDLQISKNSQQIVQQHSSQMFLKMLQRLILNR